MFPPGFFPRSFFAGSFWPPVLGGAPAIVGYIYHRYVGLISPGVRHRYRRAV